MTPLHRAATLDEALRSDENLVWTPQPLHCAPRFAAGFPRRDEGVLFGRRVLPCFGVWAGLDPAVRSQLVEQLDPLWHHGPGDFGVALLADEREVIVGRLPACKTLGEASNRLARARAATNSWWRRLVRREFGSDDVLKIPELDAATVDGEVTLRLNGEAPLEPPEALTLGRGETYRRYFVCDGPFVVWVGRGDEVELVAWLPAPFESPD